MTHILVPQVGIGRNLEVFFGSDMIPSLCVWKDYTSAAGLRNDTIVMSLGAPTNLDRCYFGGEARPHHCHLHSIPKPDAPTQ
jgi:hypothetical protein